MWHESGVIDWASQVARVSGKTGERKAAVDRWEQTEDVDGDVEEGSR